MLLIYLCESFNANVIRQIKVVSSQLDIPEETIVNSINEIDPSNKYAEWILKQIKFKNIIIPEDNNRVKEAITILLEISQDYK